MLRLCQTSARWALRPPTLRWHCTAVPAGTADTAPGAARPGVARPAVSEPLAALAKAVLKATKGELFKAKSLSHQLRGIRHSAAMRHRADLIVANLHRVSPSDKEASAVHQIRSRISCVGPAAHVADQHGRSGRCLCASHHHTGHVVCC